MQSLFSYFQEPFCGESTLVIRHPGATRNDFSPVRPSRRRRGNREAKGRVVLIVFLAILTVLVLLILGAVMAYRALYRVPHWYSVVLAESEKTENGPSIHASAEQLERRVADLISGLGSTGPWELVISEKQINGWLFEATQKGEPALFPPEIRSPRVHFEPERLVGACEVWGETDSPVVISFEVDLFLTEPNRLAIRIRSLRVGAIPWPLKSAVEGISETARKWELPILWRQTAGDPVAVVQLPGELQKHPIRLTAIQLGQGEIYLAGTSGEEEAREKEGATKGGTKAKE